MNPMAPRLPGLSRTARIAAPAAFVLTAALLAAARSAAAYPILILDRFLPGSGWAEIAALATYSAFLTARLVTGPETARLRLAIWLGFSIVFFAQLVIGVLGADRFLMTGRLHVPVPAVVIAGPLYRGERLFMPILFAATLILVGPAWCSWLCYVGAWDGLAATARRASRSLTGAWRVARVALGVATPVSGVLLRLAGVDGLSAALVAVGFGIAGAGVMAAVSTRRGTMMHCTSICPLGLVGNLVGKISPFRIRIEPGCTACGRCTPVCRYAALDQERIRRRSPGLTCTLCGDCVPSCREGFIRFGFLGLRPESARALFLTLVAALHAVFLGVARI